MYTKAQLIEFIQWYKTRPSIVKIHTPISELIDYYFKVVAAGDECD